MDSKKCSRCGCFFISDTDTCPRCEKKDIFEMSNLKSFLDENSCPSTIEDLSIKTNISTQNLSRFLKTDDFTYLSL